jgi:hypothetical protein
VRKAEGGKDGGIETPSTDAVVAAAVLADNAGNASAAGG